MIDPEMLVVERWDTLSQSKFWKTIITTTKDTYVINIASTRQILDYINKDTWFDQSEEEKKPLKIQLPQITTVWTPTLDYILLLAKKVLPNRASDSFFRNCNKYFQENNVDPWFAQTILLIESPAQLKYSRVSAYGPFQIMKSCKRHGSYCKQVCR